MTIDKNRKTVRASTVKSYSSKGSVVYDDPMNKNFLYGEITMKFLDHLEFSPKEKVVLDLGCGTGFIFEYRCLCLLSEIYDYKLCICPLPAVLF